MKEQFMTKIIQIGTGKSAWDLIYSTKTAIPQDTSAKNIETSHSLKPQQTPSDLTNPTASMDF